LLHLTSGVSAVLLLTDPATPEIYTLSLHDALPISDGQCAGLHRCTQRSLHYRRHALLEHQRHQYVAGRLGRRSQDGLAGVGNEADRKNTRLNSSHVKISYAVFCLKKKRKTTLTHRQ